LPGADKKSGRDDLEKLYVALRRALVTVTLVAGLCVVCCDRQRSERAAAGPARDDRFRCGPVRDGDWWTLLPWCAQLLGYRLADSKNGSASGGGATVIFHGLTLDPCPTGARQHACR
jgi:hypothetical protein